MKGNNNASKVTLESLVYFGNTCHPNTALPLLPEGEAQVEDLDDDDDPDVQSKIVSLVLDLAKPYQATFRTITMDNHYTSVKTMCELVCMGLLERGIIKMNRKFLCQYVKFLKSKTNQYPCGSY